MASLSVCCMKCEDKELDILIEVYRFIHMSGSEYCSANEIVENVGLVENVSVNITFLRSWVARNWLQKNELEALRVPPSIEEEIEETGYQITPEFLATLDRLKENKPKYDSTILQGAYKNKDDEQRSYVGMVYMERKRK